MQKNKRQSPVRRFIGSATAIALRMPLLLKLAGIVADEYKHAIRRKSIARVLKVLPQNAAPRVRRGPFVGMIYPYPPSRDATLIWSRTIIGSFEEELHGAVESVCGRCPALIVNIGASEGYYAVGFARRLVSTPVIAFEADLETAKRCKQLAHINDVGDRVDVRGYCDSDGLRALDLAGAFIFCDCEGMEHTILDPNEITALRSSDMLVEVHEHSEPGNSSMSSLCQRFSATHHVTPINPKQRDHRKYPELASFTPAERNVILGEGRRYSVGWLLLRAKC